MRGKSKSKPRYSRKDPLRVIGSSPIEGGLRYLKRCFRLSRLLSSRKRTTRYLVLNFFFWKKGFKNTFLLLFNSILRLRLPEWKVLLEV